MLMKFTEWWSNKNPLDSGHIGYVADNKDPRMQGRVRVWIKGLLNDPEDSDDRNEKTENSLTVDMLPWYFPKHGENTRIPEVGEPVYVTFHQSSIYHGMYETGVNELITRHPDYMSEYPHRYGHRDQSGFNTVVNKHDEVQSTEKTYPDGTYVLNDVRNGLFLMHDAYGTVVEVDRSAQKAMVKLGDSVITVSPDGIALHAKHLTLSGSESLVLQSSQPIITNAPDE